MPKGKKTEETSPRLLNFQDVIDDIACVLGGADGEYVAKVHNGICSNKVVAVEDSLWAECLKDRNGKDVHIGDDVDMPYPESSDLHQNEFTGRIKDLYVKKGTVCVVDQDDECFEIEASRVELSEAEADKEWNDESKDCPRCHSRNTKVLDAKKCECYECGKTFKRGK